MFQNFKVTTVLKWQGKPRRVEQLVFAQSKENALELARGSFDSAAELLTLKAEPARGQVFTLENKQLGSMAHARRVARQLDV